MAVFVIVVGEILKQQWQFALLSDRHQRWIALCDRLGVPDDLETG